ncbi:hypothetical protein N306_10448, partial [Opisthocomus hoazin]
FLLLAQGHKCEDFERMCCMCLCDHSKLIHQQLRKLHKNLNIIEVESRLTDWLSLL